MRFPIFDPRVIVSPDLLGRIPYYESLTIHREMIYEDPFRIKIFSAALRENVEGKVVLDIGCGLGILSMLAINNGARKVYAIEGSNIIDKARLLASENGLRDKINFIQGLSTNIELPEKCDVLVSELVGHYGLEEDIVEVFADALSRLLKSDAKIIPQSIDLFLVPCFIPEFDDDINELLALDERIGIPYYAYLTQYLKQSSYLVEGNNFTYNFVSTPLSISSFDLYKEKSSNLEAALRYRINRNGYVNGFIGWFRVGLTDDIEINTSPLHPTTHWKQCFFPTERRAVKEGEIMDVLFEYKKPEIECAPRFKVSII